MIHTAELFSDELVSVGTTGRLQSASFPLADSRLALSYSRSLAIEEGSAFVLREFVEHYVRHEAPLDHVEVKGLHQQAVAAVC